VQYCTVHRDGHQNGQQIGYVLHRHYVDCCPGGRRGNTKQVVAQWRCPVASSEALVMLNWAMCTVSLQCIRVAIEMVCDGGAFVRCRRLFQLL
jgi:hypothetical protein